MPVDNRLLSERFPRSSQYNADWVLEQGAGLVLPNFRGVDHAVRRLLSSLDEYRANVAKIENRAVYEIIDILRSIKPC